MKPAGIRNALMLFIGGLIAWGLLIWLPHRELGRLSGALGRPENLPPVSRKVYMLDLAISQHRYLILVLFIVACVAYYFFYTWAAAEPKGRMVLHNVVVGGVLVIIYAFMIYSIVALRVAIGGLSG
jgi:hypothetical protein